MQGLIIDGVKIDYPYLPEARGVAMKKVQQVQSFLAGAKCQKMPIFGHFWSKFVVF